MKRGLRGFLLCVGLCVFSFHSVQAIGITPPEIILPTVLINSEQTKYVTLNKDLEQLSQTITYVTEVRSAYPGVITIADSVEIPAGKQSTQVPFTVHAAQLGSGTYTAMLVFYEQSQSALELGGETGVAITSGIAANVVFTVSGEERVEYTISHIEAQTTETDDAVPVDVTITNTGNVSWRPEKIEFVFADQHDNQNTVVYIVEEKDIAVIPAGAEKTLSFSLPVQLIQGSYRVQAFFYDNGSEVFRIGSQVFDIFPPNTLAQSGIVIEAVASKNTYELGEKVRIQTDFENTGKIRVTGAMVTSIEKEGTLVDLRKTESLDIDPGETSQFEDIFSLDSIGEYTFSVYVEYGNKKTAKKTIEVSVTDPHAQQRMLFTYGGIFFVLIVCVIILLIVKKSHQKKGEGKKKKTAKKASKKK